MLGSIILSYKIFKNLEIYYLFIKFVGNLRPDLYYNLSKNISLNIYKNIKDINDLNKLIDIR